MEHSQPAPEWVSKRDGRLVPFDADKICRSIFTATEALGRPDAFTARELTDGVLHFVGEEAEDGPLSTAQIAELVMKVVRELGHPALAQAYAAAQSKTTRKRTTEPIPPAGTKDRQSSDIDLADYALREVFAPELVSAHGAGLITLTGLHAPLELAGWVLETPHHGKVFEAVQKARRVAGTFIAVDGPEYLVSRSEPAISVDDLIGELGVGLQATGLRVMLNLGCATPPTWAGDLADGPLFAAQRSATVSPPAPQILEQLLGIASIREQVRIDWHLGDSALSDDAWLLALSRHVLAGAPLTFAFDRPRQPVPLAEGIDRDHPAALLTVGLNLPRLAEQLHRRQTTPGRGDPAVFLEKLGSLARLALSAGVQKRAFLRRANRGWPAFLLDRARLVVTPLGLDAVVRQLIGEPICASSAALELGRQIVQRLAKVLARDGRSSHLDVCLDGTAYLLAAEGDQIAGVMPWDASASPKVQLRCAGQLQPPGGAGTVTLLLPKHPATTPEELVELLRQAWKTEITRLRFHHS
jgi:hypothetical protein